MEGQDKLFRIRVLYHRWDVYYIRASSQEEAQKLFDDQSPALELKVEESYTLNDDGETEVKEVGEQQLVSKMRFSFGEITKEQLVLELASILWKVADPELMDHYLEREDFLVEEWIEEVVTDLGKMDISITYRYPIRR